jgi:hypothetical protein
MTITINLKGRLGNQMFQYAVLRNLSILKGYNFYINTELGWQGQQKNLCDFNIKNASKLGEIHHVYNQPINSNYFDENIYNIPDNTILDGHFENVEYFKENAEVIKMELTVKDKSICHFANNFINEISNNGALTVIGVHFRRGDVAQQVQNIEEYNDTSIKYVNETVNKIIKENGTNITLLIFTGGILKSGSNPHWIKNSHENDVDWVNKFKNNNKFKCRSYISPGTLENNEIIDYELMTNCDYLITPYQSTFFFMSYYTSKKMKKLYSPTNRYGGLN